jgi:CRP-like cAMP-binding protein
VDLDPHVGSLQSARGATRPAQSGATGRAILGGVDDDDLKKLEEAGSELAFGAGQMLIERGKPGTGLYVVLEGKIAVEAPEGTRELGPGSVVGERALLSEDGTRSARVRALTFGKVIAVDRAEVDRLCAEDPAFAERLARLS